MSNGLLLDAKAHIMTIQWGTLSSKYAYRIQLITPVLHCVIGVHLSYEGCTSYHGCVQGRIGILEVHARDKELEEGIDFHKVARATAGSTGAELMNLMNQSAIVTVRQGRQKITQADIFEVCCLLAAAGPALPCPALPCSALPCLALPYPELKCAASQSSDSCPVQGL